jgi:lambda-carrageenase
MSKPILQLLKPFLLMIFFTGMITLISCKKTGSRNENIHYIDANANIWNIEKWAENLWVTADYNGNVDLKNLDSGENAWSFSAGAFVFDLKTGDLNSDGEQETALVTAQGELVVLDAEGNRKWSFQSRLPLYNVGIGNFTGDERLEVVCGGIDRYVYVFDSDGKQIGQSEKVERLVHRIATGNLDDDEYDEILVVEARTIANLMQFESDTFQSAWRKPLKVPDKLINWENPRGSFFPFSLEISDLDGDGKNEIIMGDTYFNKQAVMVTDNQANAIWISEGLPPFQKVDDVQIEFYSTAFVRCADIFPESEGKEVISVAGGMFRIWDKNGNLLGSENSFVGFTDFEMDENQIILASAPNGDNYLYQFTIDKNWEQKVSEIEFRGLIKEIKENTNELKLQVENYESEAVSPNVYDLKIGFGSNPTNAKGLEDYKNQMAWFYKQFPYENLRVIENIKAIEITPPLDEKGKPWSPGRWKVDAINGTMTVDEILSKALWIEENKVPTMFSIGHSCMPFITLETAEKILQTAPNYCLGFQTAEDEALELIPRYFEHFFRPLANLCQKYGNKMCLTKNKGLWWLSSPADPKVFNALFAEDRKNVSMSATEDSNSRTPELNLMGRGGLWQAGLLSHNDVSIHGDLFSFNRFQQWEYPKAGHPYLRLLVAHTTLGMTQISTRIREIMPSSDSAVFEATGKESTEIFYHLLGKGIIFSPERENILGYSPIGMVVHQPPKKWLEDAHNGHSPEIWEDDMELHQAVMPHNGNLWGMTNTPAHALQKVLFNKERQFGTQVPATPFGLVAFVPEFTDLNDVANISEWWHTDGIYVWKDNGPRLYGSEAANALKADFEKAAARLPFRQVNSEDAVFMQIIRLKENHFRMVLVDPGWINPKDHRVDIKIQLEGNYRVENVLDKQHYNISNKQFTVNVPAGLFTVVDVIQNW